MSKQILLAAVLFAAVYPARADVSRVTTEPSTGSTPTLAAASYVPAQKNVRTTISLVLNTVEAQSEPKRVAVTAYSSTPDQTDDTPFEMANGARVHDGAIAANFLPFGTKVMFPELFGKKIFTVEDRMAPRNGDKMDVWMSTREAAIRFGVRYADYVIVGGANPSLALNK